MSLAIARNLWLPIVLAVLLWALTRSTALTEIAAGVAIFLFGMRALEEGFRAFTGGTLERILERATASLWRSLGFGLLATTLMQSSSLVSVITISFLGAGLIGLTEGVGIIFGANLGTTTGAWLVAAFGLKVDIAAYAMPLLVLGVVLLFQRSATRRGTGYLLAGLGFLFLGIDYMKMGFEAFEGTVDLAALALPGLRGLLLFVLIGIFVTVVMQSSHATLALTITALAAGQIGYESALALAIGANVGTTVTAILGALGSTVDGRRLAGAHLVFNLATGTVALTFIGPFVAAVDLASGWFGIAPDNHALKLALFHTLFNLVGVLLMLPLIGRLVALLQRVIEERPRTVSTPRFLAEAMLQTPGAALEAVRRELGHLFDNVFDIMALTLHVDPKRLRRGEGLEGLDRPPERVRPIDVDDYYQRRVKPLHGAIVDFIARLPTQDGQTAQAFRLRSAGQGLVEALKHTKHLEKNLVRFLLVANRDVRHEYIAIRQRLVGLLNALQRIADGREENPTVALDILRIEIEEQDIVANGQLDRLIRDRRITSAVATSLMNDSGYARQIARNLIEAAQVIFFPFEPIRHEIERGLHLDEQEIHEAIDLPPPVATPRKAPEGRDEASRPGPESPLLERGAAGEGAPRDPEAAPLADAAPGAGARETLGRGDR
ncbi:Na/Pi symporter [Thiococcus pfennigii]|uniref:Na/Pi symporter n=1 Tax=Thiococcus pfennigii TaxID=1057 RepID=UPI0019073BFD